MDITNMHGTALRDSQLNGRSRIAIENIWPQINNGRFPIKRCINEEVIVEANIFADGHDELGASLRFKHINEQAWQRIRLQSLGNDRWRANFFVSQIGEYIYTIDAWIDDFLSWRRNLTRWVESKQDIKAELLIGAELIIAASKRATSEDAAQLLFYAKALQTPEDPTAVQEALGDELFNLVSKYPNTDNVTSYQHELKVSVDRQRAQFSSWYELFPRSLGTAGKHGTFKDVIAHLPYVAEMGFDVLYFPPIHPIGQAFRKGKNNAAVAEPNDPGSPWGIGSSTGGHIDIHPELGTMEDFQLLVNKSKDYGMEIALDLALQCTPDHPYVKNHPEWFKHRPDGSIQYAENPPKKYQDIYPLYFQNERWPELWEECLHIVLFWIKQGVRIFRVDNPHTKPFLMWEWLINQVKKDYPETIFLSEAFTRPNIKYYLAKLGFSQSYTYFTWRNTKDEITEYLTELYSPAIKQFFRPNFWPNTPDILHEFLQTGGRPAFITKLILAATLSGNYGIYGPTYELSVNTPREPGSEEYLDSEKYQISEWNIHDPKSIRPIITKINQIRRQNSALQSNNHLHFHKTDNDQLLAYSRFSANKDNMLVVVVNLDPHHTHSGWVDLPLELFGINSHESYLMHDLLSDAKYLWQGSRNYIELNPHQLPVHIFKVYPHIHHEQDFKGY